MQQAQVNLLADMGAQPTTLMAGLVAATKSTDTAGPTVTISTPAAGAAQKNGDVGHRHRHGGRRRGPGRRGRGLHRRRRHLAGRHRHHVVDRHLRAEGPRQQRRAGARDRRQRQHRHARDPQLLGHAARAASSATSRRPPPTPTTTSASSSACGSRRSSTASSTGVRFYKGAGNTGTHVGSLWGPNGQRLAQVTFANETATGWQTATFAEAVAADRRARLHGLLHRPARPLRLRVLGLRLPRPRHRRDAGRRRLRCAPPAGVFGGDRDDARLRATRRPTTSST